MENAVLFRSQFAPDAHVRRLVILDASFRRIFSPDNSLSSCMAWKKQHDFSILPLLVATDIVLFDFESVFSGELVQINPLHSKPLNSDISYCNGVFFHDFALDELSLGNLFLGCLRPILLHRFPKVWPISLLPTAIAIIVTLNADIDVSSNPFHILDEIFIHKSSNKSCADGSLSCA